MEILFISDYACPYCLVAKEALHRAVEYTRTALKPQGVPTIYVDGKQLSLRDYTEVEMLQALNDAASSASPRFCGIDGC